MGDCALPQPDHPYDAFVNAEVFLTQPILMVAGSEATSKWMSDDLLMRSDSKHETLHVVQGSKHMKLYDGEKFFA